MMQLKDCNLKMTIRNDDDTVISKKRGLFSDLEKEFEDVRKKIRGGK